MTTTKRPTSEEELARYYEERRDDDSLWSSTPAPARVRKEPGVLFSLRLPAQELDALRQAADGRSTTVSALLRDGAKLLVEGPAETRPGEYRLPAELGRRVTASRPLVETILEEEQSFEDCVNLCIELGLDRLLTDIIGKVEAPILVQSILQLAARAPESVYEYTAEMLKRGAEGDQVDEARAAKPAETEEEKPENLLLFEAFRKKAEEASARLGTGSKA